MTPRLLLPQLGRLSAAMLLPLLTLAGCSSAQFGSELSDRPKPRRLAKPQPILVSLPQDGPFNIALPSSSQKAGLDGAAEADATVNPAGKAAVVASVIHSGTAEALFQIGHAVSNDTERQTDLDFKVRFHYEFEVGQEPEADLPDAVVGLRLYARDSRGRLLRNAILVDHSTENGSTKQEADKRVSFTLTLGPGQSVNVFLAGRAKVDIREGRSARGILKLSGLQIELRTRPAPAIRTARDEQE